MVGKRVLVMTLRYPPHAAGGYEFLTESVVAGLRDRDYEVEVLCGRGEGFADPQVHGQLLPHLDAAQNLFELHRGGTPWQRVRLHFFRWSNFWATRRVLKVVRPDVVLYFNLGLTSLAPLLAARLAGVPQVGYICDPWPENLWLREMRQQPDKAGRLLIFEGLWGGLRRLVGMESLGVASSFLCHGLLATGHAPEHLQVVPNGLSEVMDSLAPAAEAAARESGEPLRIVCTSMLWEGKGQHVLVEAFGRAVKAGLDAELVLAGGSPEGSEYRERLQGLIDAAQLGKRVRFVGMLTPVELSALLGQQHVFVLPSIWGEPFGLATIEAMAHGLCVVVSDSGASPELVEDTGVVVRTDDVEDLARVLLELGQDEARRRDLALRGRERALGEYGRSAFIGRMEGLIEAALVGEQIR